MKADIKKVAQSGGVLKVKIRLSNKAGRAQHYISDVRATRYDPATRTLTLCMSDEGREVVPGAIAKLPVFRFVDPNSDAEFELEIPDRIVKLKRNIPDGGLAFETHQLSDAESINVEVAWADVPYYPDTRQKSDDSRMPAARWEQHKARAFKKLKLGAG